MKLADDCPPEGFARLADVPSIVRIDLSGREDVTDEDVAFLASMPWLAAVSLAGCRRLTDRAAVYLRRLDALEQLNLKWTALGPRGPRDRGARGASSSTATFVTAGRGTSRRFGGASGSAWFARER